MLLESKNNTGEILRIYYFWKNVEHIYLNIFITSVHFRHKETNQSNDCVHCMSYRDPEIHSHTQRYRDERVQAEGFRDTLSLL